MFWGVLITEGQMKCGRHRGSGTEIPGGFNTPLRPPSPPPFLQCSLKLKHYMRTATELWSKRASQEFHMRKGSTSTFKIKSPLVQKVHLHKANMYGSFCTSCYKQEKTAVGEKTI